MTPAIQLGVRLALRIADMVVALEIDDPSLAARIESRYRPFLGSGDVANVTVAVRAVPGAQYLPIARGNWAIESRLEGHVLHYRSYREEGMVDLAAGKGRVHIAPDADIENFLRVLFAHLCLASDALLLHAGGLVRAADGLGYVFFGPSGAGKTTATRLSADRGIVLSDDLVILRAGPNGSVLHGVPFRGELDDAPRANRRAILRGIFRLFQADRNEIRPFSTAVAVAELAAASPFAVSEPHLRPQLLEVCGRIARQTPVCALYFRQDDSFWKAIDGYFT